MRFFARLRHVRLTTAIAALMLVSTAVTIAAYSVSTYLSLRGQALDQAVAQQSADLKTAATIYERRLNGSVLTWSEEDGSIVSFTTYSIPFFYDTAAVDSVRSRSALGGDSAEDAGEALRRPLPIDERCSADDYRGAEVAGRDARGHPGVPVRRGGDCCAGRDAPSSAPAPSCAGRAMWCRASHEP